MTAAISIQTDTLNARDWARLVPAPALQQGWAYGAACAALGSRVLRFEIRRGRETLGLAQVVHRRLLGCLDAVVCTRGPVWVGTPAPDERASALVALRRAMPRGRLRGFFVTPEAVEDESSVLRQSGLARVMTPYTTATLDLTRPEAELRAAQHQKWRNRLAVAERAGITIKRADRRPDLFQWLLDIEARQQKTRKYNALPPMLVTAWHQAGGDMRVLVAEHEGERIAAMLYLCHGQRATYHLGWSGPEGKRLSAHNLLLWHAVRKLKALGIRELDLGGLNTEDVPGIARFKLGTGAQVKTLCGTWFGR